MSGTAWLFVGCLAVGWLIVRSKPKGGGVTGHVHGGRRSVVARHEAGHVVAARAVGGRVRSADIHTDGGGLVTWEMTAQPLDEEVRSNITFLRAGQYAAGTGEGCRPDQRSVTRQVRRLPSSERAAALRDGEREARRIVSGRRGEIRRIARHLDERGSL
jgi:hypothetical protein